MGSRYHAKYVYMLAMYHVTEHHVRYLRVFVSEGTEVVLGSFGNSDVYICGVVCAPDVMTL
jgi:hypothetical protein